MEMRVCFYLGVSLILASCTETAGEPEYADVPSLESEENNSEFLAPDKSENSLPDTAFELGEHSFSPSYSDETDDEREPFDEYAARAEAERQLALDGYDYSYGCIDDCSGHEAGWRWRADNGYSTDGKSQSFAEGGYAFDEALERKVDEMQSDYEMGLEPDY